MIDIYIEAIKGISKYHIDYIAKKVIEQRVIEYILSQERE